MAGTGWEQGMKTQELNSDHISPRDFTTVASQEIEKAPRHSSLYYLSRWLVLYYPFCLVHSRCRTGSQGDPENRNTIPQYGNPTGFPRESNATASTRNCVPPTEYRLPPAE